jgi:TPR repeat protein
MGTILFLGVEGSGKTVLNMALAKVFAAHPEAGYRLKPESSASFRFLEQLPASLYATPQPPDQPDRFVSMPWSVCCGQQALLSLDIPECPADLFRLAFQKPEDSPDPSDFSARAEARADDIRQLLAQVDAASRVFVLFDPSRMRETEKDPGRLDAAWATNACLRQLLGRPYPPPVSLLLTHADRDPASGNDFRAILRQRLPLLADNYPDLPGLAVSSVKPDDPDYGLQPLLFQMFAETAPLAGLLASGTRIWSELAAEGASEPASDALRDAADRLDALRAQAPWFAQGDHALELAPRFAAELRRLADAPAPGGGIRKALSAAFPELAARAAAAAKREATAKASARAMPKPSSGHSASSSSSSSFHSADSSSSSGSPHRHHHHRHHHGGRRTPTRRFFEKIGRYIPWAIATIVLALAFTYGVPFAKRSWGQHCMDRGLRLAASRPEAAFRSFQSARKFKAAGSDIALMACRQIGIGCAIDPDAAAAAYGNCRWTYTAPRNNIVVQRLVKQLQRMADAQDPNAQYLLGRMHEDGKGFAQPDPAAAFHRMEQAVAHGQPQALQWMIARARGGDADAQILLGRLYLDDNGPSGHDAESVRWVLIAGNRGAEGAPAWLDAQARSGNAAAQYTLGRKAELRAQKTGSRDFAPALDWYRQAAAQDYPEAVAALARLSAD